MLRPSSPPPAAAQPHPPPGRLLTIQQAADHLQVSGRTVRRLIAGGPLAAVRIGRAVRIHPHDLRALERPS